MRPPPDLQFRMAETPLESSQRFVEEINDWLNDLAMEIERRVTKALTPPAAVPPPAANPGPFTGPFWDDYETATAEDPEVDTRTWPIWLDGLARSLDIAIHRGWPQPPSEAFVADPPYANQWRTGFHAGIYYAHLESIRILSSFAPDEPVKGDKITYEQLKDLPVMSVVDMAGIAIQRFTEGWFAADRTLEREEPYILANFAKFTVLREGAAP